MIYIKEKIESLNYIDKSSYKSRLLKLPFAIMKNNKFNK